MKKQCIILGGGRVAEEVSAYLSKNLPNCEIATWKSMAKKYEAVATLREQGFFRVGDIQRLMAALMSKSINELTLVGKIDAKVDIGDLSRATTRLLMQRAGTFSAVGFTHAIREQMAKNNVKIVPLLGVTNKFAPDSRFRDATAPEIEIAAKLLSRVEAQTTGDGIFDSAVISDGVFELEEENGTDGLLRRISRTQLAQSKKNVLVKFAGDAIGDVAPPAVGPTTLSLCEGAGVKKLIVAKRNTIIAERDRFYEMANSLGIELVGV